MAVSFTGLYAQDFNSLATAGTSVSWSNDVTLPGWYLFRQPSTSPIAITAYAASNGNSATGAFVSNGATGSADRALGGLGSGGTYFGSPASGADAGWLALALTNLSGAAITSLTLSFHGEQWRNGGNTSPQTMVMQ